MVIRAYVGQANFAKSDKETKENVHAHGVKLCPSKEVYYFEACCTWFANTLV